MSVEYLLEEVNQMLEEITKKMKIFRKFRVEFTDDKNIPTAAIDMYTFKIVINRSFWENLSKEEKIALLAHEIGHYKYYYFDARTYIKTLFKVAELLPSKNSKEIENVANMFSDLIVDANVSINGFPEIASLGKKHRAGDRIMELINVYLSKITKLDFGSRELEEWEENALSILLQKLDPFHKNLNLYISRDLPVFIEFYKKIEEEMRKRGYNSRSSLPYEGHSSLSYEKEIQIDEEITKNIIRELIMKGQLDMKDIRERLPKLLPQIAKNSDEALKFYYRSLSLKYNIKINPLQIESTGGNYPYSLKEWSPEDPLEGLDVFNSYGKIFPSISKKWELKGYEIYKKGEGLPPAIIVIDSSASMPNPKMGISPVVVAAYVIARRYLSQGSEIAVINFSDSTLVWDFSRNLSDVEDGIILYQAGSTHIEVSKLKKLDKKRNEKADIYILTDVQLNYRENLEELFEYLNNRRGRSFIFWINNDNIDEFRVKYKRVRFYDVNNINNLPKMVIV